MNYELSLGISITCLILWIIILVNSIWSGNMCMWKFIVCVGFWIYNIYRAINTVEKMKEEKK